MLTLPTARKTLRVRFGLDLSNETILCAFTVASRLRTQFNGTALQREAFRYDREELTVMVDVRQTIIALCWDPLLFELFAGSAEINPREYQQHQNSAIVRNAN